MRVLIIEDDETFRNGLTRWLPLLGDYEVVGSADNGTDALELFRKLHPELVTVDGLLVDDESGLQIAENIRAEDPKVVIVMITGEEDLDFEGRRIAKQDINGLDSLRDLLAAELAK